MCAHVAHLACLPQGALRPRFAGFSPWRPVSGIPGQGRPRKPNRGQHATKGHLCCTRRLDPPGRVELRQQFLGVGVISASGMSTYQGRLRLRQVEIQILAAAMAARMNGTLETHTELFTRGEIIGRVPHRQNSGKVIPSAQIALPGSPDTDRDFVLLGNGVTGGVRRTGAPVRTPEEGSAPIGPTRRPASGSYRS
jgi:hypothetical protein